MNTSPTSNSGAFRVPTRFDPDIRFVLTPRFPPRTHDPIQTTFEDLKTRLLQPVLNHTLNPDLRRQLRLAANEAAAVAWTTPFPLLFLPALLEEKTAEVHRHALRQVEVEETTQALLEVGSETPR
jgi:hypothetical protein